jgi:hypothetical protein
VIEGEVPEGTVTQRGKKSDPEEFPHYEGFPGTWMPDFPPEPEIRRRDLMPALPGPDPDSYPGPGRKSKWAAREGRPIIRRYRSQPEKDEKDRTANSALFCRTSLGAPTLRPIGLFDLRTGTSFESGKAHSQSSPSCYADPARDRNYPVS